MARIGRGRPRARALQVGGVVAVITSIAGAAGLVVQATYSSLSATTANGSNTWSVGTVALTDDDSGTAMFTATNLKPGSTGSHCIAVTSTGSLDADVKLYGAAASTTNGLASAIDLTVTLGTGGTFGGGCGGFTADATNPGVYSGTLAAFSTGATGFGTGRGTWSPAGGSNETRAYRFDWTVNGAAPNTIQSGTAAIDFTWESQNT